MRMFPERKYKSGSKWSLWRWTDVFLPDATSPYLTRLHVVQTPIGAIMLHWINRPDSQKELHDHPVSFLSVILRGSYEEERSDGIRSVRWVNFIRATDAHRIISVKGRVLTLVFATKNLRPWGFYTSKGWVPWREYKYE